jgi:hypothetical protein
MTRISLDKAIDFCSQCGANCRPLSSIVMDPLCTACIADFRARDLFPDLASNNPIELANFFADPRILLLDGFAHH